MTIAATLPRTLRDLAEIVGEAQALNLARAFGGQRITIPRDPSSSHPVAQAIGVEAARLLGHYYGSVQVEIPVCRALRVAQRNAEIRAARREGATISELARRYRLCRRSIFLALREPE